MAISRIFNVVYGYWPVHLYVAKIVTQQRYGTHAECAKNTVSKFLDCTFLWDKTHRVNQLGCTDNALDLLRLDRHDTLKLDVPCHTVIAKLSVTHMFLQIFIGNCNITSVNDGCFQRTQTTGGF